VIPEQPPTVRSGTRLTAHGWRAGPATKLDHFHDLTTDRDCMFGQHVDGSLRCMPPNIGLSTAYLDAACTDLVVLSDDELPTDEDFSVEDDPDVPTLLVGRAGERVELEGVPMYFRYDDGTCELYGDEEDVFGFRLVITAPDRFVRGTVTTLTGENTGRIVPRAIEGEDGSRAPIRGRFTDAVNAFLGGAYVDVEREHEVTPTPIDWSEPYTGEVAWTEEVATPWTTRFTDASCSQPLLALPSEGPAIASVIREGDACSFLGELHEVVPATGSYELSGTTCEFEGNLADPDLGALGALVDRTRYVGGALAVAAPEDRLTALTVTATEAAAAIPLAFFDTDLQLPCVPRRLAADPTRAVCVPISRNPMPMFGDAACTQPVLIARPRDIESRDCYAGPPRRITISDASLPPTQMRLLVAGERLEVDAALYAQIGPSCVPLVDRATTFSVASDRVVDLAELSLEQLP
jgi:hypothetical protein